MSLDFHRSLVFKSLFVSDKCWSCFGVPEDPDWPRLLSFGCQEVQPAADPQQVNFTLRGRSFFVHLPGRGHYIHLVWLTACDTSVTTPTFLLRRSGRFITVKDTQPPEHEYDCIHANVHDGDDARVHNINNVFISQTELRWFSLLANSSMISFQLFSVVVCTQ